MGLLLLTVYEGLGPYNLEVVATVDRRLQSHCSQPQFHPQGLVDDLNFIVVLNRNFVLNFALLKPSSSLPCRHMKIMNTHRCDDNKHLCFERVPRHSIKDFSSLLPNTDCPLNNIMAR